MSDFELTASFIPTDPKECNIPCTGDQSQLCGSSWRLQVYDIGFLGEGVDHPEYTGAPTEAPTACRDNLSTGNVINNHGTKNNLTNRPSRSDIEHHQFQQCAYDHSIVSRFSYILK